jgi:hypothetical protein
VVNAKRQARPCWLLIVLRQPRKRRNNMKRAIILGLLAITPAYAVQGPLKCKYEVDIHCDVVDKRIFVNSVTLNPGNCEDPIELANKPNKIRDDFIVKHPEQSQFASPFIKDYRGEHVFGDRLEIKVQSQCNLLEFTVTVDGKPYTWRVHDNGK